MVRPKRGRQFTARALPVAEKEKHLLITGMLIRAARRERTTIERFVYEIGICKAQLISYEYGGDMLLSTFLRLLYGLDIKPEDFFREIEQVIAPFQFSIDLPPVCNDGGKPGLP